MKFWWCRWLGRFELWIQTMQQQRHYGDEEDVGAREKALRILFVACWQWN